MKGASTQKKAKSTAAKGQPSRGQCPTVVGGRANSNDSKRITARVRDLQSLKVGQSTDGFVYNSDGTRNILMEARGQFGLNPQGNKKELVLDVVDYFDYDGGTTNAYRQYKYRVNNFNLIPASLAQELCEKSARTGVEEAITIPINNIGKVESVKLWALPSFGIDVSDQVVQVLFGVPLQNQQAVNIKDPPEDSTQDGYNGVGAQMTTTLTPTSVSDWVLVGSYKSGELFRDSNYGPTYDDFGNQCLFSYCVVTPDNGVQTTTKLQFLVEIEVSQTLPLLGSIVAGQIKSQSGDIFSNAGTADVTSTPCQVSLKRVQSSY